MIDFKEYAKKALAISINESISDRLKSALNINEKIEKKEEGKAIPVIEDPDASKIVTTEKELEAFQIVKALPHALPPATPNLTLAYYSMTITANQSAGSI